MSYTTKYRLIDTHAHLDFSDFDVDRDKVIARAQEEGIERIINVSSSLKGCLATLDLISRYDNIYGSIGIHPHDVKEIDLDTFEKIEGFINNKKIVAIGEVGLDFYRNLSPLDIQKEYFPKFIELAIRHNLALIIHSRQADIDTLNILRKYAHGKLRGVVHCFSGNKDFLTGCLDLGLYVSFTCNITYKKADDLREIAKYVPEDKLLLETDCPYLSPQNLRGKRNEPQNVKYLASILADIRGLSIEQVAKSTTENAKRLFGLS